MDKKNRSGKWAVILLALIISLSSLAGCKSDTSPASDTDKTAKSDSGTTAVVKDPVKLNIGIKSDPNVINFETNYLTKLVEEQMNADLSFILFPSDKDDARTKFSVMVSSGAKLPDVMCMTFDDNQTYTVTSSYTERVFINTSDYYNNPDIAVNFHKIDKDTRKFIIDSLNIGGELYGLFLYEPNIWNECGYRTWINNQWLETLNLKTPTTTDELHDTLKAFVENDPNGNSKKDEIGMVGSKNGWGKDVIVYLMNAFEYANKDKKYLHIKDDKIIASYTQDGWKQGLEYIAKLIEGGLLSPLSFTQDQNQLKALTTNDVAVTGVVPSGSFSTFKKDGNMDTQNRVSLIAPVTGPEGVSYAPRNPSLPFYHWFITKDCKDPEFAFRVGDNFLSEFMSNASHFGEHEVHWSDDPEVCALYMGDNEESRGIKTKVAILESIYGVPGNSHWHHSNPKYRPVKMAEAVGKTLKTDWETNKRRDLGTPYVDLYASKFPKVLIGRLPYTNEEIEKLATPEVSIFDYVRSSTVQFVTGNRPLSEWNSYLKELDKMGLADYLKIAQAAYDRLK